MVYEIQYVTIFCMLDLQENIYQKVKTTYMSAGFAGRHVVGSGDLSVGIFLEVQNQKDIVNHCTY